MKIKFCKLKNGVIAPEPSVNAIVAVIRSLKDNKSIIALYDLQQKANNDGHKIVGESADILKKIGFLQKDGTFLPYVKDIVCSAVTFKHYLPVISDPIAMVYDSIDKIKEEKNASEKDAPEDENDGVPLSGDEYDILP